MKNFLLVLCFCFISAISFSQDIWEGKNVRSGLIDLKGNEIIKPEKEYIYNPISDSFCFTDKSWDNFGYGSLDGNIIIPVETGVACWGWGCACGAAVGCGAGCACWTGCCAAVGCCVYCLC